MNWSKVRNCANVLLSFLFPLALIIFSEAAVVAADFDQACDYIDADSEFEYAYRLPSESYSLDIGESTGITKIRERFKKDPENPVLRVSLGSALVRQAYSVSMPKGKLGTASLLEGIKRAKNRADVRSILFEAKKHLDSQLNTNPERFPEAYYQRGVASLLTGQFMEALADFSSSLEFDMENPFSADAAFALFFYVRGVLSDEQKVDWALAIAGKIVMHVASSERKRAAYYLMPAKLYCLAADPGKAHYLLQTGLKIYPENKKLIESNKN